MEAVVFNVRGSNADWLLIVAEPVFFLASNLVLHLRCASASFVSLLLNRDELLKCTCTIPIENIASRIDNG